MTSTANDIIRVLCVDDHRLVRAGIARIVGVQRDMQVVAEASSGEQAVAAFVEHRPDVTLMDLQLPGMNGIDAIRAIRRDCPEARIVVLTMYEGDEDVHNAFEAGVLGYVLKDMIPEDLIHAIREAHAGRRVLAPEVQAALDMRANHPTLTTREHQVLQLLARGMRNKEIAAELGIGFDTASAHIKNIYSKFSVHDRTSALTEAVRRGIIRIG
jgi:DNA-binding NarL/FixJ family response regulator